MLGDCGARAIVPRATRPRPSPALADGAGLEMVIVSATRRRGVSFAELRTAAAGRAAEPPPPTLSTIGYTSGTTGHPKGAMQSHLAVLPQLRPDGDHARAHGADIVVTALPAPHVYGNVVINSTFMAGGTVVLMERFDPGAALRIDRRAPGDDVRGRAGDVRDDARRTPTSTGRPLER